MQIVFAPLAHAASALVARVVRTTTATGRRIVVHDDAEVPEAEFDALRAGLSEFGDRLRFARRVALGWGECSVVEATLNGIASIAEPRRRRAPIAGAVPPRRCDPRARMAA